MIVAKVTNGDTVEMVDKKEFLKFFAEYFDTDGSEMWLDVVEYGETMTYFKNGVSYKFRR